MRVNKATLSLVLAGTFVSPLSFAEDVNMQSEVVTAEEVQWGYLNPLRGIRSPGAADLWGDRTKNTAAGMLVKFNKGFSSPPHIHNITYRGVVIEGLMHNDDPKAESMWMPTGSFWTQPAGENHITAANGEENLIYLEIDSGPYLVQPSDEHFENGEKPINLHASNMVWLNQSDMKLIKGEDAEVTALWGSNQAGELGGTLVKLPAGYTGQIHVDAEEFRGIVIKGDVTYRSAETRDEKELAAGSYFGSTGQFDHNISVSDQDAILYFRTNGRYQLISNR
ncbi:DUF4437 domain-containing protein [Oceanimonas sp. MB9]|uniref:DUF4437 domain-containing protein n=1 Tax=Oceanimonas sp. MB9 TaxID=2588453 RepID=UPI0013F63890|nr:DUF4437 domain-containing protein [Oceanimonas sp. MB9]NHI02228.1 hypothetical protein [Oceanimonas sp. MB9]